MAFPFQTNPGDDLRRLFQIDRLERNARNLEHASIRAGKPGIRVQNVDGSTAAVLGETGSGPGIGMRHKGQVRGLGEIFADSDDVAALDGRVGTAEGRLDSHASRLGAVEGVNTTQNSRLGTIEANYAAALGGFASLAARLNSHVSRIGANEGNIQSLTADLVSALSDIDNQLGALAATVNQQDAWLRANTGYPNGGLIPGGN